MGRVELTVCAARRLHDCQLIGLPDPFVRLTMGEKRYKTQVVKNDLNPEWNETFRFQIADEMSDQIRLEVWNKGTYNDDLMGYYTLSLGGLTKGVVKDQWHMLEKSKTQAELHVRLLAVDFGSIPKPEEMRMVTTDINRDPIKRAMEDGTWHPGQKSAPPPTGPPQSEQQQPQTQGVQYVSTSPQQVQYVAQPQPVQYVPLPLQYAQPQPLPGYYQPYPPPQQLGYYPPGPLPPQQPAYYQQVPPPGQQGYYAQPPPQGYAPQPYYRY